LPTPPLPEQRIIRIYFHLSTNTIKDYFFNLAATKDDFVISTFRL
jgi:hypothetical protein